MSWEQVCDDPVLQDLPYKVELNRWGNIKMRRITNRRGECQGAVGILLQGRRANGLVITSCPIETAEGTKVADVAWASHARRRATPHELSWTRAPEICVDVLTPGSHRAEFLHRSGLFLQAGAEEFWLCDAQGNLEFFDADGPLPRSRLCPEFPAKVEILD